MSVKTYVIYLRKDCDMGQILLIPSKSERLSTCQTVLFIQSLIIHKISRDFILLYLANRLQFIVISALFLNGI